MKLATLEDKFDRHFQAWARAETQAQRTNDPEDAARWEAEAEREREEIEQTMKEIQRRFPRSYPMPNGRPIKRGRLPNPNPFLKGGKLVCHGSVPSPSP